VILKTKFCGILAQLAITYIFILLKNDAKDRSNKQTIWSKTHKARQHLLPPIKNKKLISR